MELLLKVILPQLLQPFSIMLALFGSISGIVLGAIPGLSGGLAIALLLPLTFTMQTHHALILLMSLYVGSMSGSYISAILIGIPGTPSSIATVFDGYELTKQGEPVRALSAGTVANFIGAIPGLLLAMFLSPIISNLAIKLGPWEFFSLVLCAIMMVVSLSEGNLAKGLISTGLAIILTSVGTAPVCATPRFTFGSYYLAGGFSLIGALLGLFAGRTIIFEFAKNEKAEAADNIKIESFKWPGKDLLNNIRNIIQSFAIGFIIGVLPGLGGSLSNMMAYGIAKNTSKHPEKFGTGCIDGVIAAEVANNASLGGALVPFISLGIPGDMVTALLIGALTIQGVQPGPLIYRNSLDVVYLLFSASILSVFIVLVFEVFSMPIFPKFLKVPYQYLYPAIFVLCVTGAYASSGNMYDVILLIVFTLLGIFMAVMDLPTTPFILTYVLSGILENNLRKGISYSIAGFFTRPVSLIFLIIAFGIGFFPLISNAIKNKKRENV